MDFARRMSTGETISSVTSVVSNIIGRIVGASNVTLGSPSYSGNIVQVRIGAGIQNEQYEIEVTVITNLGNTRIGEGLLRIE